MTEITLDSPTLFYVAGASGSGKDSLIRALRAQLDITPMPLVIAHRYITRESGKDEDSVHLSEREFVFREQRNFFSMAWQANGHRYGVGCEINQWLNEGLSVLVNGSRAYLPTAQDRFGKQLKSILIDVPENILLDRLKARQRESDEAIKARIERHRSLQNQHCFDFTIQNEQSIEVGAKQLRETLSTAQDPDLGYPTQPSLPAENK